MDRTALLLREIKENGGITQRRLAARLGISLGAANSLVAQAQEEGLLTGSRSDSRLTPEGEKMLSAFRVNSAVILAAGFGSRFVPLTWETPKGLLKVFDERMIERQIRQLREAGITDIYIMVGYLKEKFDYLIDKYGVKLIFNPEYDRKNNISTLRLARDVFCSGNTYLLNSDNWIRENIYHAWEPCSWYSAVKCSGPTSEWCLSFNKKKLITGVTPGGADSWVMYGPAYFTKEFSQDFFPVLERYYRTPGTENMYWEQIYADWVNGANGLDRAAAPELYINMQPDGQIYEFENLEELRAFDEQYIHSSDNEAMRVISSAFGVPESEIVGIRCLKAGMTNRSFGFELRGKPYICRVPGEGTEKLIDRRQEAESLAAVKDLGITEDIVFFDPETGYKISEYYPDARTADIGSDEDMRRCMQLVHRLHESGVTVGHDFDIAERLEFYEGLCITGGGIPYEDYLQIRAMSRELLDRLAALGRPKTLAHIDSCVDNLLFIRGGSELRLIDWEYAGMADPLIDIAMCAIYSYRDRAQADHLTDLYFGEETASPRERGVVYAYMALGGLLWALWAIYKSQLGVSFGEYTLVMYHYAKYFYRSAAELLCPFPPRPRGHARPASVLSGRRAFDFL